MEYFDLDIEIPGNGIRANKVGGGGVNLYPNLFTEIGLVSNFVRISVSSSSVIKACERTRQPLAIVLNY